MNKILTSFASHLTAEGERLVGTYSVIDDNGNVVKSNARFTTIAQNEELLNAISMIKDKLTEKIPE